MTGKSPKKIWKSPLLVVLVFVVLFYAMTFIVYYFYGPGPEERNQAVMDAQRQQAGAVTLGEQQAGVTVTVDDGVSQQLATQESGSQEVSGTQMSTQQSDGGR